ncbi:hypothetical protein CWE15_08700 [Aliidiomarina taiwanensis]|uniref:DUF560 domain-containing protein n=1 Tax=Aliidiomarina taiwanensis TaxID=946228 RepID=A0A432X0U3_9GAMM|nr:tetratricopeptide repeat protein [Aliidiomarina taiwanensis]RUO39826.1 hypothetical protein CWE15_08700 [Aliidiomarina taiwanensis]
MRLSIILLACLIGLISPQAVLAQSTSSAETLTVNQVVQQGREYLTQQKPAQAYALFQTYEPAYAGQPQYDYWYGVAAIRHGQPFPASLALERAIAKQPLHAGARLELVAAYIQLDQYESAEIQLNHLDSLNPPPRAQQAMDNFRQVIADRRAGKTNNPSVYSLSLDAGYDSNYLNYPDSFDLFADTILEGLAILEADGTSYNNVRGLAWKRWNGKQGMFVEASLLGQMRINHNSEASIFDTRIVHGKFSFGTELNKRNELKFGFEASHLWLDNQPYRTHTGLHATWKGAINASSELVVNGAFREFRFDQRRNDYVAWSGDVEWRKALSEQWRWRNKAGLVQESVTQDVTRQGGNARKVFISTHLDYNLSGNSQLLSTLGYENHTYSQEGFAVFNHGQAEIRDDDSIRARLEWIYMPSKHWRFSLFGQYRNQASSIDFFELDQTLVQGSVTYVF